MSKDALKEVDFGELFTVGDSGGIDISRDMKGNDENPVTKEVQDENEGMDIIPFNGTEKPAKTAPKGKKEEKEDTELEDDDKIKKPLPHNDTKKSSTLSLVFAKFLNEGGLLSNYDEEGFKKYVEENGDESALEYLFNSELETRLDELKKTYDEDQREYIDLKDAGVDASTAKDLVKMKSAFESIKEETLEEDENLRKQILTQHYYNTTSFSDEKIRKLVDLTIESGKDIDEAKDALKEIRKFNDEQIKLEKKKVEDEEKASATRAKESREKFTKTLYETKEILGQQVNKPTLQKIEKFLEPSQKDPNGNPIDGITAWFIKNPTQARINLAYGIMTGLLDGKTDKLEKKARTNVIKDIEDALQGKGSLDGKSDLGDGDKRGRSTLDSMMKSFKLD